MKVKGNRVIVANGQEVHAGTLKLHEGEYVLVYANLAVEKISKMQAMYTQNLIKQ